MTELNVTCYKPTLRNFAWLITGIFLSRSVSTGRIALELGWKIRTPSITRRLSRILANKSIRVRDWYRKIAENLLKTQAKTLGQIRLIVDGSKIGNNHQLLMVSIAYRRRSIPIAWTWVPHKKGHCSSKIQKALLGYVKKLMPTECPVLIVGDAEFGNVPFMQLVNSWGWKYVLRQKSSYSVKLIGQQEWMPLGDFITKTGQKQWLGQCHLTKTHAFNTNLYIEWREGEKDAWLLTTNLETKHKTVQAYNRRMWIEEMFGDMKRNGFDLECAKLKHFNRLSRMTLAVVLLLVWLMDIGSRTIKNGKRSLVDRSDRRDYSIFRIGYNFIKRMLGQNIMPEIPLKPYFT